MIIKSNTIEFDSIDDLCIFVRYNPKNDKSVPSGYILNEDVVNKKGGILYTKDSEIDAARITRLKRIMENNPDISPKFVIKINDDVVKIEHVKIMSAVNRLMESKAGRREFTKLMQVVKATLGTRISDILKDPEITLYISHLKFLEDKTKKSKINPFYNHMLNTLIFATGIMANYYNITQEKFAPEEVAKLGLAALLHGAGGWEKSGEYMEFSIEERHAKYVEANSKNYQNLKSYKLDNTILEAIEFCYQFQIDKMDFLKEESKAAKYAQVVCLASWFNEAITGLWKPAITPREAIDVLYIKTQEINFPKVYVDALAKGLNFNNLFDFYHELDVLNNACHRASGKPYPMTGFKSPVMFVCKNNMHECKEYVASAKSINIFKSIGGLEEGSYGRCEGLSKRLIRFYDEHYRDIKDEVIEKAQKLSAQHEEPEEEIAEKPPAEEKPAEKSAEDKKPSEKPGEK